jgi:hypothetical protein
MEGVGLFELRNDAGLAHDAPFPARQHVRPQVPAWSRRKAVSIKLGIGRRQRVEARGRTREGRDPGDFGLERRGRFGLRLREDAPIGQRPDQQRRQQGKKRWSLQTHC